MNKREQYESIVDEVTQDLDKVTPVVSENYEEMVYSDSYSLSFNDEGVILKTPISVFSDYAVRDRILIKACESPEFGIILIGKVNNFLSAKVDEDKPITQEDVEALATASQIALLWEQYELGEALLNNLNISVNYFKLRKPPLASISEQLLSERDRLDMCSARTNMHDNLIEEAEAKLDV